MISNRGTTLFPEYSQSFYLRGEMCVNLSLYLILLIFIATELVCIFIPKDITYHNEASKQTFYMIRSIHEKAMPVILCSLYLAS